MNRQYTVFTSSPFVAPVGTPVSRSGKHQSVWCGPLDYIHIDSFHFSNQNRSYSMCTVIALIEWGLYEEIILNTIGMQYYL